VTLEAGAYTVEWFHVDGRETTGADEVTAERSGPVSLRAPSEPPGPATAYLKKVGG
jgi:hypothetical protein